MGDSGSDKGAPCGQCVRKGRDCIRATKLKFRHITGKDEAGDSVRHRGEPQYEFSESQQWCRLSSKRLRFIDETAEINTIHNDGSDSEDDTLSEVDAILASSTAPTTSQSVIKDARNAHVTPLEDSGPFSIPVIRSREEPSLLPIERGQPYPLTSLPAPEPQPTLRSLPSNSLNLNDLAQNVSSNIRSQFSGPIGSISDIGSGSSAEDPSLPEPRRTFDGTSLPLRDRREAYLVRFFVDHIAAPFDFGDTFNRVSTLIPQYAALSPVLLNAVLALAAKSNDREEKLAFFDKPASRYHDIAVDLLEPVLSDSHSEVDEIQFAAAVLLRIYQIIDTVRATIQAPPAILDFLTSHVRVPEKGSLLEATIWSWMNAEIFRSVMRNEPLNLCFLDPINFDRSLEPADDHVWAFRMILHTIDILDYVFGETKDPTTYSQLASYAARWIRAAPDSFTPVFVQSPPENEFFPEILLINDSAVLGNMHYQLSRVLLTMHNPDAPRLSKRSSHAARVMKVSQPALVRHSVFGELKIIL
ncbi:ArcA-like protein [Colletotrichum tabaci]|uniref:ArcA-like protein n=1 Tax=Colletotrichum tabaci TaxID=1209068 RepID=A0AAV9SY26_9PEZI